ncbi:MAG: ATP-binding protein [Bellilinea sp.]|nr:ATP-binding protein [Bellilinea sp.]
MPTGEPRFSELLQRAINRIAFLENKTRQVVFDELGYALGRQGGSAIQYWLYHQRVPARLEDVENLARIIAHRGGWEHESELRSFLSRAGHPHADTLIRQIFPNDAIPASAPPAQPAFIVGPPILKPHQFFGRTRELRRIFTALNSTPMQNVAVCGLSRSGKTSLLHYIHTITRTPAAALRPGQPQNWLEEPQRYRWVYVDFQDPRVCNREGFFVYILRQLNFPAPSSLDLIQFVDIIVRYLVNPTVILLDEIQIALTNPEFTQQFWWSLRSLSSNLTDGKLAFVIAAQNQLPVLQNSLGKPSPFLNIFGHSIQLGPLSEEEARQLIQSSPIPFSQSDANWIIQHSGCWPALLQILCSTRLVALQENQSDEIWKADALANIQPYRYLLETP